jgi:hypothetical protein
VKATLHRPKKRSITSLVFSKLPLVKINKGGLLLFSILTLLTAALLLKGSTTPTKPNYYPEVASLGGKNLSFKELSTYFESLADQKGAAYAYEVLKVAPIPPGIDMHLLGHVVGDKLFKQQGASGIKVCTQDFRNACSHAIVVGLFLKEGDGALPEITSACRQAPGGSGAYSMCFHGLGHGILTYVGYDLPKAESLCEKTSSSGFRGIEAVQCVSGTVMEIISGGGHDHDTWERQNKKYLSRDKPLSLCQESFIPDPARPMCYVYLTPYLFIAAGADLAKPTPQDFKIAFTFCEQLPLEDTTNRGACFGGFGKEFVVLAQNRDIRIIDQMTEEQLALVYNWCSLTKVLPGQEACLANAENSLYWGGENKPEAAIKLCTLVVNGSLRQSCFRNLTGAVFYYKEDERSRQDFCIKLPSPYQEQCQSRLSGQGG